MLQPAVTATETSTSRWAGWILMKTREFYGKGWMGFVCVLERNQWKMLFEDDSCFRWSLGRVLVFSCFLSVSP